MAEKYFITFLADSGVPGHAFVNFGRESDTQMSSITDGTFGMYPKEVSFKIAIGEVPGKIKDDFMRKSDYKLILVVSKSEYDNCKAVLQKWRSKNYELGKSDCLSFVMEVANALPSKLSIPSRVGFDNLPAEWLKKLIQSN